MPHPKQIDFGFNVARLSRRLRQAVDAELQAFGLTDATWRPLAYVGRLGGGVRHRARGIYLTQAGHDLAVRVAKVGTEIQLRLLSSVPQEDLETCQRVLAQIERQLDEDPIEETSKRRNR